MAASPNPVGEIVVGLRKERGITQEQLAECAGVDRKTVQRLEKSKRISAENLKAVADALRVSTTSLYGPRSVTALVELAEELTCRHCGSPVVQSGSFDYQNVDVDYEAFACGAQNGLQFRPCPKDPRFPSFADYEIEYYEEGGMVYAYALGKTEMARSVPLDQGFGQTKESAAKVVERSFIATRDGCEAAEDFYPWSSHQ